MNAELASFVDLQVNGYAGFDFNTDSYTDDEVTRLCSRLRRDGVSQILATIITASPTAMLSRITRVASLIEREPIVANVIAGIHVEGPFLSPEPGYVGAHPAHHVRLADTHTAAQFVAAGKGHVRLMTLAPERDPGFTTTRCLIEQGVIVAGGHSNASYSELENAIDAGMQLYTHLGNGCPGLMHRHDNIIQRVLAFADRISISFIADGHHVTPFALKNYLKVVPRSHVIIVTDAISAAGLGPGRYPLGDQFVDVDDTGAAWAADRTHYAGCASTMNQMVQVLEGIDIDAETIKLWTSDNPRRFLASPLG